MISLNIPERPIVFADEAAIHLQDHIGINLTEIAIDSGLDISSNKGRSGDAAQTILGLKRDSRLLDAYNYELKTVLGKRTSNGKMSVSSEIAVTMLNCVETENKPFHLSKLYQKIQNIILVIKEKRDDQDYLGVVEILNFKKLDKNIQKQIKADYDHIAKVIQRDGDGRNLTGSMGICLMPKTKGPGRGAPKTRAFYLRKDFVNYILGVMSYEEVVFRAKKRQEQKGAKEKLAKT